MKKLIFSIILSLFSFVALAQTSSISINGMLKNPDGTPRTGSQTISVVVSNGIATNFSTTLNVTANDKGFYPTIATGIPSVLFSEGSTTVTVDGMTTNYTPTPYSDIAGIAKTIDGSAANDGDVLQKLNGVVGFAPLASNSPVYVMNQQNFSQGFPNGSIVYIDGDINISGMITLEGNNITYIGGRFLGSGTSQMRFGDNVLVQNTKFEALTIFQSLGTSGTAFVNARFHNVTSNVNAYCSFSGGKILNSTFNFMTASVNGTEIEGSTIEAGFLSTVKIYSCTVNFPKKLTSSHVSNSDLKPGSYGSIINGNTLEGCFIEVSSSGQFSITNNTFEGVKTGKTELFKITTSSWYSNILISNNNFSLLGTGVNCFDISGTSNAYTLLVFSQNTFNQITVFNSTSTASIAILENTLRQSNIGTIGSAHERNTLVNP
jgi:hypothetical protein